MPFATWLLPLGLVAGVTNLPPLDLGSLEALFAALNSADDGEVIEFSQSGFASKPFHRTLAELGGREVGDTDHMVTETLIRGMYRYWREVMEAP